MPRLKVYDSVLAAWLYLAKGSAGTPGSVWRSGAGVPDDGTGIDGDYYLRTSNGDVYLRSGGTYSVIDNITGPTGAAVAGQLFLSAAGGWPSISNGCASPSLVDSGAQNNNYYQMAFDSAAVERAEWGLAMPSDWDAGTITAKFYWTHPAATSFGVVWSLQGVALGNDEAIDTAQGSAQQIADTGGTTQNLYITADTPAITIAGATAGDYVQFLVTRVTGDGGDTLDADARLIGVMIGYSRL